MDLFSETISATQIEIRPGRRLTGTVGAVLAAHEGGFQSQPVDALDLSFEGITGDFHAGHTRRSGGREPWYPRGTQMRNERQLSLVAADELAVAAQRMEIAGIEPGWIGANLVLGGIAQLSMLPAGTLLFFANGVTLKIDGQNHPCKLAGRSIAEHCGMEDVAQAALLFPKHARRLRGLVAWVEKSGRIVAGEGFTARIPEQWIY